MKIRPKSIGAQLVLAFTVVLLAGLFAFSAYLYIRLGHEFNRQSRQALDSEFGEIAQTASKIDGHDRIAEYLSLRTHLVRGPYRMQYLLLDSEGLVLAGSEGLDEDPVLISAARARLKDAGEAGRVDVRSSDSRLISGILKDASGKAYILQLFLNDTGVRSSLRVLLGAMFWVIPVCVLLAVCGGLLLSRRVLSPVKRLTGAARKISLTNLEEKLPLTGTGDELDELAVTFNTVFGRLRESYQKIVRFTADASHELRLPITAIRGEAEVTLERSRSIEDHQKVLASILEEFDRLVRLINHLLSLTRADSGREILTKKPVRLEELLAKMVDFYTPLAEEKGVGIAAASAAGASIRGDEERLQELFSNLIENAIKYTARGGQVNIAVRPCAGGWEVEVRDTGIGIPKEEQGRIFERFYRVDKSRSRQAGGDGLGLSIAETIAKAHGARIRVESEPGKGSAFIVEFPA